MRLDATTENLRGFTTAIKIWKKINIRTKMISLDLRTYSKYVNRHVNSCP